MDVNSLTETQLINEEVLSKTIGNEELELSLRLKEKTNK